MFTLVRVGLSLSLGFVSSMCIGADDSGRGGDKELLFFGYLPSSSSSLFPSVSFSPFVSGCPALRLFLLSRCLLFEGLSFVVPSVSGINNTKLYYYFVFHKVRWVNVYGRSLHGHFNFRLIHVGYKIGCDGELRFNDPLAGF